VISLPSLTVVIDDEVNKFFVIVVVLCLRAKEVCPNCFVLGINVRVWGPLGAR